MLKKKHKKTESHIRSDDIDSRRNEMEKIDWKLGKI